MHPETTHSEAFGGGPSGRRIRTVLWSAAAIALLLPLIAMGFTDEVAWTTIDFVFFGGLLASVGITFELAVQKTRGVAYRAGVGVALAAAFLLVWANGAVGLIGGERNPANLMYLGVLGVGVLGALLARFEPLGLAWALFATAAAQALVAAIAMGLGLGGAESGPLEIAITNGVFVALFAGAGWLFHRAAHRGS